MSARGLATFHAVDGDQIYDGVWANFSLLHAPPEEFPGHLLRLNRALRKHGLLHIAMKLGSGTERDQLGRFYAYYSEDELVDHLASAGFSPLETTIGEDKGLAGSVEPWIAICAAKERAQGSSQRSDSGP